MEYYLSPALIKSIDLNYSIWTEEIYIFVFKIKKFTSYNNQENTRHYYQSYHHTFLVILIY